MNATPLRRLLAALLIAALPAAHAALDADADTDDHSVNVPTAWWTFQNLTPNQLRDKMASLGARTVEVEVTGVSSRVPRMTVRLVADRGAYAVPGATFTFDRTASELETVLAGANARLIELERYDAGRGDIRYAAVYVPNSGATARAWGWLLGRTRAEIQSWASANNQRIMDLDSVGSGSSRRWNAVLVANTGDDYKRWDWDVDQTLAQVSARLSSFGGRLVKLDRQSDGRYAFVQVDNTGANATAWWYGLGFSSLAAVNEFAAQMGGRPVDIVRYTAGTASVYDAVVIDNANEATRAVRARFFDRFLDASGWPIGIFQAYVKRIDNDEILVSLNASRAAETASALKSLHLLHAMKQVNAGDPLDSSFSYYNYPTDHPDPADACPDPAYEDSVREVQTTLESGLDAMMNKSDNRTTRGVVLRYGGFAPLNATASAAGLKSTVLRHNIGCGYWDFANERYSPSTMRNDTSAADLAAIWIGVQKGRLLPMGSLGRAEFLESGNPRTGAGTELQAIILEEALALGLDSSVATTFGTRVKTWGKGGSYHTCLGSTSLSDPCGQTVSIASSAGLLALPLGGGSRSTYRYHGYGSLMSDVPVPQADGPEDEAFIAAWRSAHYEMFRSAVRSALQAW